MSQLDFFSIPAAECVSPDNSFYDDYRTNMVGIMSCLAITAFLYLAGSRIALACGLSRRRVRAFRTLCVRHLLSIISATFIIGATTSINLYRCVSVGSTGSWLVKDAKVSCGQPRYRYYARVGVLALIAYPIGFPAFMGLFCLFYRVPYWAARRMSERWLQELLALAAARGLPVPTGEEAARLRMATISGELAELLHSNLVQEHAEEGLKPGANNARRDAQPQHEAGEAGAGSLALLAPRPAAGSARASKPDPPAWRTISRTSAPHPGRACAPA